MKFGQLVNALGGVAEGDTDEEITGLCTSSAAVGKGNAFFCYRGEKYDSHSCAAQVRQAGAAVLVCERKLDCPLPQIIVPDGRAAVAKAARAFYGEADRKLKIVGVTGTNGKTTVTYMLDSIFRAAGKSTGVIGTLGVKFAGRDISRPNSPLPIRYIFIRFLKIWPTAGWNTYSWRYRRMRCTSTKWRAYGLRQAYSPTARRIT